MKRDRGDDYFVKTQPDDLTLQIMKFLSDSMNQGMENVEIEAKFGTIVDRQTNRRWRLPVQSETIVDVGTGTERAWCRFESSMTMEQHAHFNRSLNALVERGALKYSHIYQRDVIYPGKVRVSYDKKTNKELACIRKSRVGDLHILRPNHPFDVRISINLETPTTKPTGLEPTMYRNKDRLSYAMEEFQIDLTQVTSDKEKIHELELEFRNGTLVFEEAMKHKKQQENRLQDLTRQLVNNIRIIGKMYSPKQQ